MFFENTPRFLESGISGPVPSVWYGPNALDGDAYPWLQAPIGSIYYYITGTKQVMYQKVDNGGRDSDWSLVGGNGVISESLAYTDFTDGGAAVGTYTSTQVIPIGATVTDCNLVDVVGFAGDTSAVIVVGDGSTADRYMTGTPSVFATPTGGALDLGAVSGTAFHNATASPKITITTNSDWGAVTAGRLTMRLHYRF